MNQIQALIDCWPVNVQTFTDYGCGDGKISTEIALTKKAFPFGLDTSTEALKRCGFPTKFQDVGAPKLKLKKSELSLCVDVLEHLDSMTRLTAISNLFSNATDFVFIVVPFEENLMAGTIRCQNCKNSFHVNGHLKSFRISDLFRVSPKGWSLKRIVLSGAAWQELDPIDIGYRQGHLEEFFSDNQTLCTFCNSPQSANSFGSIALTGESLKEVLNRKRSLESKWVRDRNFSEVLFCFVKDSFVSNFLPKRFSRRELSALPLMGDVQSRDYLELTQADIHFNLSPLPQLPQIVQGDLLLLQIPNSVEDLAFSIQTNTNLKIKFMSGERYELAPEVIELQGGQVRHRIEIPKTIDSSYYGNLIVLDGEISEFSIQVPLFFEVAKIAPVEENKTMYLPVMTFSGVEVFAQISRPMNLLLTSLKSQITFGLGDQFSVHDGRV